jgi:hypothetical protein
MVFVRNLAAAIAFSLIAWGLSSAASASSQDYCAAYAGQRATNKTGTEVPAGTAGTIAAAAAGAVADEKWQGAYNKAFVTCMENYEPQPPTASADAAPKAAAASKPSKPKVSSKPRQAKVAKSTRSSKRKHAARATKTRKSKVTRSLPASSGPRRVRVVVKATDYCAGSHGKIASCRAKRTVPTSITMDPEKVGPESKN